MNCAGRGNMLSRSPVRSSPLGPDVNASRGYVICRRVDWTPRLVSFSVCAEPPPLYLFPDQIHSVPHQLQDIRKNEDPRLSFSTPEFKEAQRVFTDSFKVRAMWRTRLSFGLPCVCARSKFWLGRVAAAGLKNWPSASIYEIHTLHLSLVKINCIPCSLVLHIAFPPRCPQYYWVGGWKGVL